jgi:hypothetical protein
MTNLIAEISRMIAGAKAMGAPMFGLEEILVAAERVSASIDRAEARRAAGDYDNSLPFAHFVADAEQEIADLKIIETAARAAWAFVVCKYLPHALRDLYANDITEGLGKDLNDAINTGIAVGKRYPA